jgi:hypothetical protein
MVKLGELTGERLMGSRLPGASVIGLRPSLGLALRSWGGPSVVGPRRPLSRAHMLIAAEHFRCNRELRPMWRTAWASSSVDVTLDVASSGELKPGIPRRALERHLGLDIKWAITRGSDCHQSAWTNDVQSAAKIGPGSGRILRRHHSQSDLIKSFAGIAWALGRGVVGAGSPARISPRCSTAPTRESPSPLNRTWDRIGACIN